MNDPTSTIWHLTQGTVLGRRYEVLRPLGRGGFGEVYEVADRVLAGSRVALKIFPGLDPARTDQAARFGQEVLAMARLRDQNVVRFFDVVNDGEHIGYTLELIHGISLRALALATRRPALAAVLEVLIQIGRGVRAIHDQRIIHCDLKPENVLVSTRGNCKVTDFGIARFADACADLFQGSRELDEPGSVWGTVDYVAPEVLLGDRPGPVSDLYALGVIGYWLIAGREPFSDQDPPVALKLMVQRDPPPLPQLRPDCPSSLASVIDRAVCRDPAHRQQSVAELLEGLQQCGPLGTGGSEDLGRAVRSVLRPRRPSAAKVADPEVLRLRAALEDEYRRRLARVAALISLLVAVLGYLAAVTLDPSLKEFARSHFSRER